MPEKKTATRKTAASKTTAVKKTTTPRKAAAATAARPTRRPARAKAAPSAAVVAAAPPEARETRVHRGHRRTKVGRVVSAKTPKTVIVEVERLREHPLYKKVIKVRTKFASHDATGEVKAGDLVRIQESRPFSATKRWQVIEVLSRIGEAYAAAPEAEDIERALEETEGVTELLSRPERETEEASVPQPAEDDEVGHGSGVRAGGANTKA